MAVTLRPITENDTALLFRIYASTRLEELAQVPWSPQERENFLVMQFHAQHNHYQTHYPHAEYSVIMRGTAPIGRLYVERIPREIHIIDIALLPEFRRQGIGALLLNALIAEANEDLLPIRIYVERNNPALRLYERLGFKRIGDSGVYYELQRPATRT